LSHGFKYQPIQIYVDDIVLDFEVPNVVGKPTPRLGHMFRLIRNS